jgi:MFS family permease
VREPEIYLQARRAAQARVAQSPGAPAQKHSAFLEIFRPPFLRITVLGGLVGTGAQGGYNAISIWLPTFLRTERGLSVLNSSGYLAVLILGSFCGYVSGGYLSDRLGRRMTFLLFALSAGMIVATYTSAPIGNRAMLLLGFPLGFFGAGVFSGMGAFYTEQFPTRVRGVGQGFAYNIGRALGAFFPAMVGFLSTRMGLGAAIGAFAFSAYAIMAVAAFLLPETRGKALTD